MSIDDLFERAAGQWQGTYRLWLKSPVEPETESSSRAEVSLERGGASLVLRYDWRFGDDDHLGIALVSRTADGGIAMGWSDTFHADDGVMQCAPVGTSAAVLAHYGPEDAPWGWRTEFDMPSTDQLCIRAFNIFPDGREQLATEALYERFG